MSAWPTGLRQPDVGFEEEIYFPQIKNDFESGYVQSRPKATVAKRRWDLTFSLLPPVEYGYLETHFLGNQGGTFSWTHPISSTVYTARYAMDSLKPKVMKRDLRTVKVLLEQVP
jgi:hypothetical protein